MLKKDVPDDYARLDRLYRDCDVLLLPTRGECAGIVFCEAAAYGMPVVATRTGGVQELVVDGETGYLLPVDAEPGEFARTICERVMPTYRSISRSARRRYEMHLNWDVVARKIAEELTLSVAEWQSDWLS